MLGSIIQSSLECLALLIYADRPNWFIEWAQFETFGNGDAGDSADRDAGTGDIVYSNECQLLSRQHHSDTYNCINSHMIDTMTIFLFILSFAVRLRELLLFSCEAILCGNGIVLFAEPNVVKWL